MADFRNEYRVVGSLRLIYSVEINGSIFELLSLILHSFALKTCNPEIVSGSIFVTSPTEQITLEIIK